MQRLIDLNTENRYRISYTQSFFIAFNFCPPLPLFCILAWFLIGMPQHFDIAFLCNSCPVHFVRKSVANSIWYSSASFGNRIEICTSLLLVKMINKINYNSLFLCACIVEDQSIMPASVVVSVGFFFLFASFVRMELINSIYTNLASIANFVQFICKMLTN